MSDLDDLRGWWMEHAAMEAERTVPKAIEYGADDLLQIGRQMANTAGRDLGDLTDAEAVELGIAFYAYGKLARIMAAIKEGRTPSEDSWFDLGVYSKMVQRVRWAGGWPGQ